jgi:hypothetical protein
VGLLAGYWGFTNCKAHPADESCNIAGVGYILSVMSAPWENTEAQSTAIEVIAGCQETILSFFVA